jgi:polyhydroxybutyrate depolymerase
MYRVAAALLLLTTITIPNSCDAQRARRGSGSGDRTILRIGGRDRGYIVRVPPAVARGSARVPLVIVLHGGGGNAVNAESMTGFTAKANAEKFIVVYPDGTGRRRDALLTWNAGHCCGYAMEKKVDDVGFIRALIDTLIARYPVDSKRVFVTGMSNGAMMTHRLGIELSDRVAAIAPVVGALFGDEARPRFPVSALIVNGLVDESVPYAGGAPGGRFSESWDGTPTEPAVEQGKFWAAANGCARTAPNVDHGRYLVVPYSCPGSLGVESYTIKDGGHAWPGGQKGSRMGATPSTAINATNVIWTFFAQHPKR